MTFDEAVDQVRELLQQRGRVTYRSLKLRYQLDDELLAGVTDELISAERVAADEDGKMLVWIGTAFVSGSTSQVPRSTSENEQPVSSLQPLAARPTDGERRQLTVEFIDLVGSTTLSQQLDPEDYHAYVVAYQKACRQVIALYDGHIAQYLGDGVLVYFGYPTAHEDDAVRAVRSGLEIVTAVGELKFLPPLQVRIGIHTGPVVVGEIGAGEHTERLALGETPNLAARVQGVAEPNTVFISQATYRLVQGFFRCEAIGPQSLKNVAAPLELYRVHGEGEAHTRFEVSVQKGLTPLVGRESELGVLRQRWEQAQAGAGHVVLLSGEPGIGKSRLVQELKEHVIAAGATRIEFRCSPYHQNTALYPITEHLQRLLQFQSVDTPHTKRTKLAQLLSHYRFPQAETLPLLAALFSLSPPAGAPPLSLSPQKQKQLTLEALVAWLLEEAERAVVYCAWEDLHWTDPSTLEVLTLFLDQVPTTRVLMLLTFRPEFPPPWGNRSHLSQMMLSRLGCQHVETMVEQVTRGKALPAEVVQHIVAKTDGVPLFVEELTKTVVESGLVREEGDRYVRAHDGVPIPPLAIPATLQDSLMARLDRLATVREIAQLGATIGREFSYELLQAVSLLDEATLQHGLKQLVEAELIYQRGLPPQARYIFKHALIQDAAYQSLLKSKRQQYHQQIAKVLKERFSETVETQPELLAHHYTEAGLIAQAIPYWQRAGQKAIERSAHAEAISHLTKGLELIKALPDTVERARDELGLQTLLGLSLASRRGYAVPEVEQTYRRARELCQRVGSTTDLFPAVRGLCTFYIVRDDQTAARELAEQCLRLAQDSQNVAYLIEGHTALGYPLCYLGELEASRMQLEQCLTLYEAHRESPLVFLTPQDPGVACLTLLALVLWLCGYPNQALQRSQDALTLAQQLEQPFNVAYAHAYHAMCHQLRREPGEAAAHARTALQISTEHGFEVWLAAGTLNLGVAQGALGQPQQGITLLLPTLAAWRAGGTEVMRPYFLSGLAEAYRAADQFDAALAAIAQALEHREQYSEHFYDAALYRLRGELTLARTGSMQDAAEADFLRAIEIARKQQAKSLELRAVMSLSRLWQKQGKKEEARQILAEIYGWFTEGFDTKDLQEAKALLDKLS